MERRRLGWGYAIAGLPGGGKVPISVAEGAPYAGTLFALSDVLEFRPRRDDTLWAVMASVGRMTRVAEIFPSKERALADRAWREAQIKAYSGLLQSCRQPAPLYSVAPIRREELPRAWKPLPALGFLRGQFI